MIIYVETSSYCDYSERSDEEFGSWEEHYTFSVDGVSLTKRPGRYDEQFDVDFTATVGDPVYVLTMRYGDGDSYGHCSGKGEVLWVFSDPRIAEEAKRRWQFACDVHSSDWRNENKLQSCSFRVDGGRWVKLNNPVWGYFESLESLELQRFTLTS